MRDITTSNIKKIPPTPPPMGEAGGGEVQNVTYKRPYRVASTSERQRSDNVGNG